MVMVVKNYDYEARALVDMGTHTIAFPEELSEAWLRLAQDLGSAGYREAMSELAGIDLRSVPMEVNVFFITVLARAWGRIRTCPINWSPISCISMSPGTATTAGA
nr:hypothetical protein GCM10020185_63830 [Pseudomonas brassicacearum subsp. brassicacearum]